jgi:hypothetical protein
MTYLIEFALTLWGAMSVRWINRRKRYGLYSGAICNSCFLTYWYINGQFGFLVGDFIFTTMYSVEIYREING